MFIRLLLVLTFEQAEALNRAVDIVHSFFPYFSFVAVFFLLESLLPYKEGYESVIDKILTYVRLPFVAILTLTALSQGFLGGCVIYYPQTWFNQAFLGIEEPYEFGLFGRQMIDPQLWPLLRGFYFIASVIILLLTVRLLYNRVPESRALFLVLKQFQIRVCRFVKSLQ